MSKAVGGAVVRNRVKRRLRHLSRPLVEATTGLQVVVRALPPAAAASSEALARDLDSAWRATCARLDLAAPSTRADTSDRGTTDDAGDHARVEQWS